MRPDGTAILSYRDYCDLLFESEKVQIGATPECMAFLEANESPGGKKASR
jgi:hypothetical protein